MKRAMVAGTAGAALIVAAIAVYDRTHRRVLIPGDQPVTELQVRQRLQAEGYTNIEVMRSAGYFEVSASKDGKPARLAVDTATGRLANEPFRDADEDDEGDATAK
jgi:UDP-N-acetyl-D-mannosaminuronic acid transferase (WecB/TagA/CpsF family)